MLRWCRVSDPLFHYKSRYEFVQNRVLNKISYLRIEEKLVLEPNPPHGDKRDFIKLTVTLPPAVSELIAKESLRRKIEKRDNPSLSAILREAAVLYLGGKKKDNTGYASFPVSGQCCDATAFPISAS